MIKYSRGRDNLVFYTKNVHLYIFSKKRNRFGMAAGITLKHRVRENLVHQFGLVHMRYKPHEKGYAGRVNFFELSHHKSRSFNRGRIAGSKRYIRLKVCV